MNSNHYYYFYLLCLFFCLQQITKNHFHVNHKTFTLGFLQFNAENDPEYYPEKETQQEKEQKT